MAKRKSRHHSLTIYLIKEAITDPLKIIPNMEELNEYPVVGGHKRVGTLYVKHTPGHLPPWFDFVSPMLDTALHTRFKIKNVSAILLLPHEGRIYAVCFGHGHQLLDEETVISDFGLKATLNSISPDAVRQIDRRRLDSTGRIAFEQAGQEIPISQFGLDIEQDLIRRVTARPIDSSLGLQLSGRDSLRVAIPATIQNIGEYLDTYLRKSQEQTYRQNFEFIDAIQAVSGEVLSNALQDQLIASINSDGYSNIWMAPPDIVDWDEISGFRYTNDRHEDPRLDIDINSFRAYFADDKPITWDLLRKNHVLVCNLNGELVDKWLAYKCLYAELQYEENIYILTEGKWYRIDADFSNKINRTFEAIGDSALKLPEWGPCTEADYNRQVVENSDGYYQLLDRQLIAYPGGHNKIEFCDLLSQGRHLIHIKKFRSSSGLSHLSQQAANSAEYTRMDRAFREKVNTKLQELHIPDHFFVPVEFGATEAANYEVVFGIATKYPYQSLEIPFFSKVSICNATRRCEGYGYKVSKLKIVRNDLIA